MQPSLRSSWIGVLLSASAVCAIACASSEDPAGVPLADDASVANPFGSSACGQCALTACAAPAHSCSSDPECGAWLGCLQGCGATDAGVVDSACEAACASPLGSTGLARQGEVQVCLAESQAACAECGGAVDAGHDIAEAGPDDADAADANPILEQVCPASPETQPCWKCEDEQCCDTYHACKENAECEAFSQCMKDCVATTEIVECTNQCAAEHPSGYDDYLLRMACIDVLCTVECGENTDPCWACGAETCAEPLVACLSDRSCNRFMECSYECADDVCMGECASAYPGAQSMFQAYTDCLAVGCVEFCGEM